MDWNLKKMWPAATASLVAVTSLANAADDMQMRNLENRVSALEQRKGANGVINPSARPGVRDGWDIFVTGQALYWKANETGLSFAIQNDNCEGCTNYANIGTVLESRAKYNWGFNVGIGYNMPHDGWDLALNWTRFHTSNGFDCCDEDCCEPCCEPVCCPTTSCCDTDDCCPTSSCGSSMNSGMSMSSSCCEPTCCPANPCDNCCQTECCEQACTPCCCGTNNIECCENIMFPTNVNFVAPCVPPGLWSCDAFSKWNLKLDMLDLVLGRDFFVSKFLSLRPNFGLRGLKIRQTQSSVYNGFNSSSCFCPCKASGSVNTPNWQDRVKDNEKYWGVGPKAGLDTLWSFGGGFGLYGNAAISLVYGRLKVKHTEIYIMNEVPDSPCDECNECPCECECEEECTAVNIRGPKTPCQNNQYKTRAVTDIALGLSWDRQLSDDKYHVGLNVGWEHHMFFGMNQFYRFMSDAQQGGVAVNQGDLATQGLTFGARFDF